MNSIMIGSILFLIILGIFIRATRKTDGLNMGFVAYPTDNIITGGQPSLADLSVLKERGVSKVINLRGLNENLGFDQAAELKRLGIKYIQIPMSTPADLTVENTAKLDKALKNIQGKALLHCVSSNRVGALLALRQARFNNVSPEEALAFGKSAGMKSLTSAVQEILTKQ